MRFVSYIHKSTFEFLMLNSRPLTTFQFNKEQVEFHLGEAYYDCIRLTIFQFNKEQVEIHLGEAYYDCIRFSQEFCLADMHQSVSKKTKSG